MESHDFLRYAVVLLAAAVVAVPIAKRLQLGAVLGYLLAGAVIGPAGLGWLQNPERIASISELGGGAAVVRDRTGAVAPAAVGDASGCVRHRFAAGAARAEG